MAIDLDIILVESYSLASSSVVRPTLTWFLSVTVIFNNSLYLPPSLTRRKVGTTIQNARSLYHIFNLSDLWLFLIFISNMLAVIAAGFYCVF